MFGFTLRHIPIISKKTMFTIYGCVKIIILYLMKDYAMIIKSFALFVLSILILFMFESCYYEPFKPDFPVENVWGYRPIYSKTGINNIFYSEPEPIKNPGKFLMYKQFIFINETGRGVHILNNENPTAPFKTGFIEIPGCIDFVINNDIMYADNNSNLVAIDINSPSGPLVAREEGVFNDNSYPQFLGVYFECVEPEKGEVVRWVGDTLQNPKCYR